MAIAAGMYYFGNNENDWSRPAVFLMHGAGGNHLYWPPEIRRMGGERIYAVDLPGHGKSEGIGRQLIADYARAILDLLDTLKIRKAIFVGHSMGGAIALHLGIHNPSRVLGLGLVSTGARLRVSPQLLDNLVSPSTFPLAAQQITEWSYSSNADSRLKEISLQRLMEVRPSVLQGDLLACDAFDCHDRLGRIKAPTLVLCGTADRMTPLAHSQVLHDKIKNSLLHTVDGAGHNVMLENPVAVANNLKLFIKSIPYQPGAPE